MQIDEQDTAKLHSEINQYINQSFVIAMTAVTVFGVVGSWILGDFTKTSNVFKENQVRSITFLLSILLIALLSVLFHMSQITDHKLLVLAAYLREKKLSSWEYDFQQFQNEMKQLREFSLLARTDQAIPILILFLTLGIFTFLIPIGLMLFGFQNDIIDCILLEFHVIISLAYCIIVSKTLYYKFFPQQQENKMEDKVDELWRKVINRNSTKKV